MKKNNTITFNKIKYKDLAIAVVLSGASLLLFPTTTKAATNESTPTDSTTATLVQKNSGTTDLTVTNNSTGSITSPTLNQTTTKTISNSSTKTVSADDSSATADTTDSPSNTSSTDNSSNTTLNNSSNVNSPSTTTNTSNSSSTTLNNSSNVNSPSTTTNTSNSSSTTLNDSSNNNDSSSSNSASSTDPTTVATSDNSPSSTPLANNTNPVQATTSDSTNATTTTTNTTEQSATYTIDNDGNFVPAYKFPASGLSVVNVPNSTPDNLGLYSFYIQAVTVDGKTIGTRENPASTLPDAGLIISPAYLTRFLKAGTGTKYADYLNAPVNKDYNDKTFTSWITDGDVIISAYFENPTINIDYKFMDENTGKEITDENRTYTFEDNPSLANGIEVPQIVKTDSGFNIVDNSGYSGNTITNLPYFGSTGTILNNNNYVLDTTKSNGVTPLDIMQYPVAGNNNTVTEEFWYKEAKDPTITIDATNQFGDVIKTFSSPNVSPSTAIGDDSYTAAANKLLPSASDTNITNNDLDNITITETNSTSGQADKTTTYQLTPTEYASILTNTQNTYNYRDTGDYQNVNVQLGYTTKSVPLYIQPTDPNGNKIGDPIATGTGVIGQQDTILAPTVTGYSPTIPSESITVSQDQGPVDFPYISATDINPNDHGSYLYDGKFSSIPSSGIQAVNTGTASTDPTAEHSISIQAVDTDGNPLGSLIPITKANTNTTYSLDWSSDLVKNLNNSIKNASQYELWNKDLNGQLNIPVTNQDVVVDVIYALPKVTTTYNYVDENTGQSLLTQTNTWNLDDPTNSSTYKSQGIRPPMTIIDPDSGQLVANDLSPTPQTNPADLPFFGPAGTIFNTGQYQLDSVKSGMTTPSRYITWPSSDVTKTFYYTENPDPTITLDAVNQVGKVIKTFNAPTVVSTLPAPQLSPAIDFPTIDQATINGYTLTGIQVHATGSYFGGTDTDYSYNLTPAQYADFISSTSAQSTMDERAIAAHANFGIHFTYTGNTVSLMVQPVDTNGNKIGNPISVGTGIVGSPATFKAPELANYQAVNGTSTITVDPNQNTFEIPYTRMTTPDTGNTSSGTSTEPNTTTTGSSINNTPATHNTDNTSSSTAKNNTGGSNPDSTTGQNTDQSNSHSVTEPNTNNSSSSSTIDNFETHSTINHATNTLASNLSTRHTAKNTNSITSAQIDNSNSIADYDSNNHSSHSETTATINQTNYNEPINKLSQNNSKTNRNNQLNLTNSQFAKMDLQEKLPQTGNKLSALLSAVGLAILGIMGFCLKKIKKFI